METKKYDIFTFQMNLIKKTQLDLFDNAKPEELFKQKNMHFHSIFNQNLSFYHRRFKLNYKIEYIDNDFILLRLANKKSINIEKEFHRESFESEPSCLIAIYNDPEMQYIAIESDKTSFGNSFTVVKILLNSFERELSVLNFRIKIHPKYEEKEFWKIIDRYESRVEGIRFEFEYPNLPRVNEHLTDELRQASKLLNSSKTKVEFSTSGEGVLQNLNEENIELNSLVKTSAEGAGPAKIKIKNLRRWESTDSKVKSFEFDELEIDAPKDNIENYVKQIKRLLKDE